MPKFFQIPVMVFLFTLSSASIGAEAFVTAQSKVGLSLRMGYHPFLYDGSVVVDLDQLRTEAENVDVPPENLNIIGYQVEMKYGSADTPIIPSNLNPIGMSLKVFYEPADPEFMYPEQDRKLLLQSVESFTFDQLFTGCLKTYGCTSLINEVPNGADELKNILHATDIKKVRFIFQLQYLSNLSALHPNAIRYASLVADFSVFYTFTTNY